MNRHDFLLANLFGRVNEVHVFLDDDEECGYYLEETIEANTIADVPSHDAVPGAAISRRS